MAKIDLDKFELAWVLCGLRMLQVWMETGGCFPAIPDPRVMRPNAAADRMEHACRCIVEMEKRTHPTVHGIDELCERINTGD